MGTLKLKAQPTNAFFASVNQMFGSSGLPASDHCRARADPSFVHISNNETVLGSGPKLWGAAKHLIDGTENAFVGLSLLLKGTVTLREKEIFWKTPLKVYMQYSYSFNRRLKCFLSQM